ncbi:MAG: M3 family oligoendopeptidase [Salinivirgaceae bacterium]|jgi:oligoendopeptidase F|nr:M3 family oligoendopeptidase [Salinivirgaceae bacterium]
MANKLKRKYISSNLEINSFEDIKSYFEDLKTRTLSTRSEVWNWLVDRSELESILSEDLAWRYIKMNCNTADKSLANSFNNFVAEIEPKIAIVSNELDQKFYTEEVLSKVDSTKLFTVLRELKKDIELFREANVPIEAELQQKEQDFGVISSKMLIAYNNEEITLQKAGNFLKENDRNVREEVYNLINKRRIEDAETLNNLLTELIKLRQKIATNAGFKNFRDYKFKSMGRFDYGVEDCKSFHKAIAETVKPIIDELHKTRKSNLKLDTLRPWDLDVDTENMPPLKPFEKVEDLIRKTTFVFRDLELEFGMYLNEMKNMGYLDLDSRKNKAPGGFNYPLHESNVPFIFMNSTGNLRDVVTMLHEGGHAVHAYLCSDLELVNFKQTPAEIAELASMSMELITMDYWHYYFDDADELKRAKRLHLEDVLSVLPWVATIDKFQHFLYENPNHTFEERKDAWLSISKEFGSSIIDYSGYEKFKAFQWQKQLHIYEVPFYYIEYAIAQLGAIAVWKNFKENKQEAIINFKKALKMGYTSPIPHIYKQAGIEFNFSKEYIAELMLFVKAELVKLQ